jgi:RimJ/RimL family protein N-acetyltransferase
MNLQPTLHSVILSLIPLQKSDFEDLFAVAHDPLIWEQHPNSDRYKLDVFKSYFDKAIESQGAFKVIDMEKKKVMGCTRYYELDLANQCVKIGYTFLDRNYWGGLYNREMKELMINYAFEYIKTTIFEVATCNARSCRALEKIGAKLDASTMKEGIPYQIYKIQKSDWLKS